MNRYLTKSQKYDSCKNHPLFTQKPIGLAPNLPHEIDSQQSGNCGVPGCWHNKSALSTPSPAPLQETIKIEINENGKDGVQESSGPEARETPQRSSLLVNNGQSSINQWGKKQRRQFQRLMTLLYRWESMGMSIIRLDLTTAVGGDAEKLTKHYETLRRRIEKKIGKRVHYWWVQTKEANGVLHTLMAAEDSLYVDHEWLSKEWEKDGNPVINFK